MTGRVYVTYNVEMTREDDVMTCKATIDPRSVSSTSEYPEHITGDGWSHFLEKVRLVEDKYGVVVHLDF